LGVGFWGGWSKIRSVIQLQERKKEKREPPFSPRGAFRQERGGTLSKKKAVQLSRGLGALVVGEGLRTMKNRKHRSRNSIKR